MNTINFIKTYTNKIILNDKENIYSTMEEYLNKVLLNQLTTLKGRLDAIKKLYGFRKLVPLYITNTLILFPINNLKDYENIYINAVNIINIYKHGSKTVIEFQGSTKLCVNKNCSQVIKYYQRALSINHNS